MRIRGPAPPLLGARGAPILVTDDVAFILRISRAMSVIGGTTWSPSSRPRL
jgi:hypothetical protein